MKNKGLCVTKYKNEKYGIIKNDIVIRLTETEVKILLANLRKLSRLKMKEEQTLIVIK